MSKLLKDILSVLLWVPAGAIRAVFWIIGWFAVPFINREKNPIWGNQEDPVARKWYLPGKPDWLRNYLWHAWRNPTNNLRYHLFDEPKKYDVLYGHTDPDQATRKEGLVSVHRFVRAGLFSEYWYQRKVKVSNWPNFLQRFTGVNDEFFEFRIGWKFSSVPGFMITVQARMGN